MWIAVRSGCFRPEFRVYRRQGEAMVFLGGALPRTLSILPLKLKPMQWNKTSSSRGKRNSGNRITWILIYQRKGTSKVSSPFHRSRDCNFVERLPAIAGHIPKGNLEMGSAFPYSSRTDDRRSIYRWTRNRFFEKTRFPGKRKSSSGQRYTV